MAQMEMAYFNPVGGYMVVDLGGERRSFYAVYNQTAVEAALAEADIDPVQRDEIRSMMRRTELPLTSGRGTRPILGDAAVTIAKMARPGEENTEYVVVIEGDLTPRLYSFCTSQDPTVEDAVVSYCDPQAVHHIAVAYSKRQLRKLVKSLPWLEPRHQRYLNIIARSGLPEHCSRRPEHITGHVAEVINIVYETKRAALVAAASLLPVN